MKTFAKIKKAVLVLVLGLLTQLSVAEEAVINVTLLGTGSPVPSFNRFGPSTLVNAGGEVLLFDAGRGAFHRMSQLGVNLRKVDKLFITHLHSDHIVGVPDILLSGWIFGRKVPLDVYGPKGSKKMFSHLQKAFEYDRKIRVEDVGLDEKAALAKVKEIKDGIIYESNGVVVRAIEVDHFPIKPAFGYRVDYKGRSVVISGDTVYSDNLLKWSKGVDLLVHEVAAAPTKQLAHARSEKGGGMLAHHIHPQEAGKFFTEAKPRLAVYSHIVLNGVTETDLFNETRKTYDGAFRIGQDLMRFEIGDFITIDRL